MKKITKKVSYLNYCLYICGVMKDNDFHHAKNEKERETFTLKIERWINLHRMLVVQAIILIS